MDVGAIREAVALLLRDVLRCEPYVQDSPNVPCAVVYPSAFDYGNGTLERPFPTFTILLLAGAVSDRGSQLLLDAWISDEGEPSVVNAVEAGGRFQVTALRSYGTTTTTEGGVRYFSAELDIIAYS